jgi:DNA-binding NtrC family response regulator
MRKFLLVDDEINVLRALQRTLRQCPGLQEARIEAFTDPREALMRIGETAFDLVISDYRMPEMDGVDFLKVVREVQPDAVRLMLSASSDFEAIKHAINQAEIFRYINKPWQADEIGEVVQLALERRDKALQDRTMANELRAQRGEMTPQELEAWRLEVEEPGITKVTWGPDGSVIIDG